MQIHSFSKVLSFPFIIALLVVIGFSIQDYDFRDAYSFLIFPLILVIAICFAFAPQINYWWYQKYPLKIDEPIRNWLLKYHPFYQSLSTEDRSKFENRLSLFLPAKEFGIMGSEKKNMPDDLKAFIASNAIHMTFGLEDYRFDDYENIIAYPHPFPTPFYKHLHTVEVEETDGVILLSNEQLLQSMMRPDRFYNIGLHAFGEAFVLSNPNKNWPQFAKEEMQSLCNLVGMPLANIYKITGFDEIEFLYIAIHHFFQFAPVFKNKFPLQFGQLNQIFQQY